MSDLFDEEDKIIELSSHSKETVVKPREPGTANKEARKKLFKDMAKTIFDEAALEQLTEQEERFAELIVSGSSLGLAFAECFPDRTTNKNGKPQSPEMLMNMAMAVSRKRGVRIRVGQLIDQEEEDGTHTARRLSNLIRKRLEYEALNANTPGARLNAIKQLRALPEVQVADTKAKEQTEKELAPEQVLDSIRAKLDRLKA